MAPSSALAARSALVRPRSTLGSIHAIVVHVGENAISRLEQPVEISRRRLCCLANDILEVSGQTSIVLAGGLVAQVGEISGECSKLVDCVGGIDLRRR